MPDLIVVVPGITGSVLRHLDGRVVWQSTLTALARLGLLTLPPGIGDNAPEHGLVPDGLVAGWHGWPGLHTGSGYSGLVREAQQYSADAVRIFGYDWRLSNRYTAKLLAERVERWLDSWRAVTGDDEARVFFLCHSMGGLIVRYYLEVLGGRELASRVLTLGTPFGGSVKAIRVLTGDAYARVPSGDRITSLVRTFPSVGQLLPAYRCVGTATLAERLVPGLPTSMVVDGMSFHSEIAAAVARNGPAPYSMHVLAGTRNDTLQRIAVNAGRVSYLGEQGGDGTVATFAAVPPEWTDTSEAEIYTVRHAALADAEATMAAVRTKFDLDTTRLPAVEIGLGVPDIAPANRSFSVVAHTDRDNLRLQASLSDLDSDTPVSTVAMQPAGDGDYTAELSASAGLWRIDVTAVAELPPVTVSDLVYLAEG